MLNSQLDSAEQGLLVRQTSIAVKRICQNQLVQYSIGKKKCCSCIKYTGILEVVCSMSYEEKTIANPDIFNE